MTAIVESSVTGVREALGDENVIGSGIAVHLSDQQTYSREKGRQTIFQADDVQTALGFFLQEIEYDLLGFYAQARTSTVLSS